MENFFAQGRKSPYYDGMKKALTAMDKEIYTVLGSKHTLLNQAAIHLHKNGGKHLRPGFIFLGGHFGNYDQEQLMPLAVALEITHMATLVHDDVVDSAALRRNSPTIKALWGNNVSVYTGNYLLAKSMTLISQCNDSKLNSTLAAVALEMCSGEIAQLESKGRIDITIHDYLLHIKQKTALLLSAGCELGAYFSGAPKEITEPLKMFGKYLGMAFQITDDILDYSPHAKKFGKILGGDIRQGIATLPLLYTMARSNDHEEIRETFNKPIKTDEDVGKIIKLVTESGGLKLAQNTAEAYIQKSKNSLDSLPPGETKDCFLNIANFILTRKI